MAGGGNRVLTWSVVAVWCVAIGLGITYWVTQAGGDTPATTTTAAASTTTVPLTTTTRPAPNSPLTVALAGEIVCDDALADFLEGEDGARAFAEVMPLFAPVGMGVVSLATPISTAAADPEGPDEGEAPPITAAPPLLAEALATADIDVVNLAGRYLMVSGSQGLFDTLVTLEGAAVGYAGAGGNLAAARSAAFIETPTGLVALLAFGEAAADAPGASDADPGINPLEVDEARMLEDIAAAKQEADWVIVTLQWHSNTTSTVDREQRRIAHRAVDAGADLILGSCPHVIQGIEVYRNKPIAYSLGDLAYGGGAGNTALLVQATLPPAGAPGSFEVIPLVLSTEGTPLLATGETAQETLSWLVRSSSKWDVTLKIEGGRAVFTP